MPSFFIVYRYLTFAFFIICNAIICSVAAGNLGSASSVARVVAIDSFWIAISALGLVFIFPIIFVDVGRKGAISSRVWFELTWVALFWMLDFAGAAAVTAISPGLLCDAESSRLFGSSVCGTTNILVVFSWLCFGALFAYFITLTLFATMHQKEDNRVWDSGVRQYQWFGTRESLNSAPATPIKAMFQRKSPSLAAPKARRPPPIFIQQRAGLSSKYEIEHFAGTDDVLERPVPTAPVIPPRPEALSLYPQHVQTTMHSVPAQQSSTYYASGTATSPPPIRNWPRQMNDPSTREQRALDRSATKGKRRAAADEVVEVQERPTIVTTRAQLPPAPAPASPSRPRPSGPRTYSAAERSRSRPPPLDLNPNQDQRARTLRR